MRREPVVYAFLHEDEWVVTAFSKGRDTNTLVSLSQDGALMTRFVQALGLRVARGSSSREGAKGLIKLKNLVEGSRTREAALAVDGPRGPRRVPKSGAIILAKSLKAPLVLVSARASRFWLFERSWAKNYFPKPFAKLSLDYVRILTPEELLSESEDTESLRKKVEQAFLDAKA